MRLEYSLPSKCSRSHLLVLNFKPDLQVTVRNCTQEQKNVQIECHYSGGLHVKLTSEVILVSNTLKFSLVADVLQASQQYTSWPQKSSSLSDRLCAHHQRTRFIVKIDTASLFDTGQMLPGMLVVKQRQTSEWTFRDQPISPSI